MVEVRGEVYMTKKGFEKLNAERKAAGEETLPIARNSAAGSLKQLDPRIVAKRPLAVIVYGMGEFNGGEPLTQHDEMLAWLKSAGFKTPEKTWQCHSPEELIAAIDELDKVRHKFVYETDGAVIKLNSFALRERAGFTVQGAALGHRLQIRRRTGGHQLKAITIQVGRTGELTPVAELEPVFLAGSTIAARRCTTRTNCAARTSAWATR